MHSPRFIHLRLHSEFSITDGIVRIEDVIKRAIKDNMPALGISDLMNIFGLIKFYNGCREHGIKPIVSCDVWLENEKDREQPYRLMLTITNRQGYKRLCTLLTDAYIHNQYRGRAELKRGWLESSDNSGLICLSGAHLGDVGQALLMGHREEAYRRAEYWKRCFPDSFYLEVQRLDRPKVEQVLKASLWLASETKLPVVATHPIQFIESEDFKAHDARVCIAEGSTLGDKNRPKSFDKEQYFLSTAEMRERFKEIPEALENSVEIARRCNLRMQLGSHYLPRFPTPAHITLDQHLIHLAKEGLEQRLNKLYPNPATQEQERLRYNERLSIECKTIIKMGFSGYFLIVADFINWAKNNECPVGPGRGSGAGSLVAYSLGITDIDPLTYSLLFERFLNPERVSMPDFDIDFCQDNRYRVIEYVRQKYGSEAVSQIATFGTMTAKAVVRDVGRALDLPYMFCDGISKLIPTAPGKHCSLDEAIRLEPLLRERLETEEELRELWTLAKKLEGLTRNISMHAGGVLIAPGKITDFCPMYQASGDGSVPVSMLDKDDVEKIGLLKFDFLGLRNLAIIDLAVRYIKDLNPDFDTDLKLLKFTDTATYQTLQQANTTAVFQLESEGMKRLLEKLKPDRFEDIIAVLALYRPGPLGSGMVDDFILRKAGKQAVDYYHPDLKACLEPTYGVIVYQEQVMQISQIIGGYTLGGADMLRRAMGKKKSEEMAEHREKIAQGAAAKGYDPALAEMLFDLMAKFAEYGFNKSHTAAYAVISYQTAWLKAHHPAAFMAATMSSELDNTTQLKALYDDSMDVRNNLRFLPPDINESYYRFVPVNRKHIRYALGALKGTGEAASEHIVAVRTEYGPFKDLFDFCRRIDKRIVNKRVIETLIRAGAFDSLDPNRAKLAGNLSLAMEAAGQENANANQGGLFDIFGEDIAARVAISEIKPWSNVVQLSEEKRAIGFYLSGHPFTAYAEEVRRFIRAPLSQLRPSKKPQLIAGFVTAIRIKLGNRGKMAIIQLDDGSMKLDINVFSDSFDANRSRLKEDVVMVIEAKVSEDNFTSGLRIIAKKVYEWGEARSRYARSLSLKLTRTVDISKLKAQLHEFRSEDAGCPVRIHYHNGEAHGDLMLPQAWNVRLEDGLLLGLQESLGHDNVKIMW